MELGLVSPDAFSGKLTIALRDWSMRRSALTICPIDRMARYLASRDIPAESLSVVHHWADRNEIMPVEPARNPLRRAWGLGHKFVVGYSGNFGRAHEFATVLDAAERLKHMKSIVFLMVGEGQQRGYVESEVKRRGLSNVVMKPFQPVEKLSESLCAANVHLVSLKPELEHCIVPSKFYGVLAAARPTIFIGDTEGEIGAIVRDFECGIALRPGEVDALVMAILHLRHSRVSRTTMGHNARYLMETAYSREYGTAMWQSAIGRLEEEAIPDNAGSGPPFSSEGNVMDGSVVVSQLGARMHYAVPRIFASRERLAHFYTDICALQGWPRLLNGLPPAALPASVRRLVGRAPQGIPRERMTTFPGFGLHSAMRRLANQTGPKSTANAIWAGETFGKLVADSGFHGASGVYAFSGEALEMLTAAKGRGLWTAVEQMIAPRTVVDRLAREEEALNPGWQQPVADDVHAPAFAGRERPNGALPMSWFALRSSWRITRWRPAARRKSWWWCPMALTTVSCSTRVRACRGGCAF